jgi:predicted DNA-binding WGR domain protein
MSWYNPLTWGDESKSAKTQRTDLNNQGGMSSVFADQGQTGFGALGAESQDLRQMLAAQARGENSVVEQQLRQGLQSNVAAQRSMAASASPQNAAMAARQAAINAGRMGMGLSGQAATARIQEQQAAQKTLGELLMAQRAQELQAALGSRQNAISGYGGVTPEKSGLDKAAPLINAGVGLLGAYVGKK